MNAVLTGRVNHHRTKSEKGFVKGTETSGSNRSAMRLAMKSVKKPHTPKAPHRPNAIADLAKTADGFVTLWKQASRKGDVARMGRYTRRINRITTLADRLQKARTTE